MILTRTQCKSQPKQVLTGKSHFTKSDISSWNTNSADLITLFWIRSKISICSTPGSQSMTQKY